VPSGSEVKAFSAAVSWHSEATAPRPEPPAVAVRYLPSTAASCAGSVTPVATRQNSSSGLTQTVEPSNISWNDPVPDSVTFPVQPSLPAIDRSNVIVWPESSPDPVRCTVKAASVSVEA
jgi:hypothetical protein